MAAKIPPTPPPKPFKFKPPTPKNKPKLRKPAAAPEEDSIKKAIGAISQQVVAKEPLPEIGPDKFLKSKHVYGLTMNNFIPFIRHYDLSMILFYDPEVSTGYWCRPRFVRAAETTQRENHAYGAVDCTVETDLCCIAHYKGDPLYSLYSKGRIINRLYEFSDYDSESIRNFVEKAPVLQQLKPRQTCDVML